MPPGGCQCPAQPGAGASRSLRGAYHTAQKERLSTLLTTSKGWPQDSSGSPPITRDGDTAGHTAASGGSGLCVGTQGKEHGGVRSCSLLGTTGQRKPTCSAPTLP